MMTLFDSISSVVESDQAVQAYNKGLLTEHQLNVALNYLGTSHFYDTDPLTGQVYKSFSPILGKNNE